jgi:hypothetical protein
LPALPPSERDGSDARIVAIRVKSPGFSCRPVRDIRVALFAKRQNRCPQLLMAETQTKAVVHGGAVSRDYLATWRNFFALRCDFATEQSTSVGSERILFEGCAFPTPSGNARASTSLAAQR